MSDFGLLPERAPVESIFSPGLRIEAVTGDSMEPTLSRNDYVLITPTDRFLFDGVYLINDWNGTTIVRAQVAGNGMVLMRKDNPAYETKTRLPRAEFNEMVLGFVVADVKVRHGASPGRPSQREGYVMSGLNQKDFDWMRGMLAGRTPSERQRMKAVVERMCADFDLPRPIARNPELTGEMAKTIAHSIDALAEVRTMLFAVDMACGDVGDGEAGEALRTIVRVVDDRVGAIKGSIEALHSGGRA